MTLTFATVGDVLLREVLERPADDSPRLILADWLDERGDEARAEFIRVQCELSRGTPAWRALRRRERELLGGVGRRVLDELRSTGGWAWTLFPGDGHPDRPRVTFRRGFVDEVSLPCRQFLREGVAAALCGAQPVTRVELSDRAPREGGPGPPVPSWYFCRVPPYNGIAGHDLPAALWDLLPGGESYAAQRSYAFRLRAEEALSAACVLYGRAAAGLPPLEG